MGRLSITHTGRAAIAPLRRAARDGRPRPVLRLVYESVIAVESAGARAWTYRSRVTPVDPGNVNLLIKTFERPRVLRRMLASVRRAFSGPIIIADDSRMTFTSDDPLVTVLPLPFDTGIGRARNILLDAATTEYVWMADDDLILLPLDVHKPVDYLQRNANVDLYAGRVMNLPHFASPDYTRARLFTYAGAPRVRQGTQIDGLPVYYKVPNFYVARTERVRMVRYDDQLKRNDHNDFFTRAYGELLCVMDDDWSCLHAHSMFNPYYQSFRTDTYADSVYLGLKYGATARAGRSVESAAQPES